MNLFSPTLLVIVGPTAVGKTSVAIEVAQKLKTVILSADSRQCYRELNIGVARPSPDELATVPHYFIASHSILDKIDAAYYEQYALDLLQHLFQKNNTIVATGGTGLYIKALVEGLDEIPQIPEAVRGSIIKNYGEHGIVWLQQQLQQKDPTFAATGEMQNPQRMMRALEVVEGTGRSIISFRKKEKTARNFNVIQVGLEMERGYLYSRINQRVENMMEAGLEAETRELLPYRHLNALQTVGYKEMFDHFDGNISLDQATRQIQQHTRQYAKRQMTWFKKQPGINWIPISATSQISVIAGQIETLLKINA